MQLLSCGSDGLMKLWVIKSNTCVSTMDEHEDKVWSVTVNKEEDHIVTGGADSSIILWKDVTGEEVQKKQTEREDFILKEQQLSNLLHKKKYLRAIGLAITLEQPFRVLNIIKEILYNPDGKTELEKTLQKLRVDQIDSVLRFAGEWNTNSRHCHEAQFVLNAVLKTYPPEEILKFPNIKSTMEAFIPYTERHFQRMNRLLQQAMFLEFTWSCMRRVTDNTQSVENKQGFRSVEGLLENESDMEIRNNSSGGESDSDNSMDTEDNDEKDRETEESANEDNVSVNGSESDDGSKSTESSASDGEQAESDIENIKPAALSGGERLTGSHRGSTSSSQDEGSDSESSEGEHTMSLENLKGSEKVMSSKKKSQQKSNVQNNPTNKRTTKVKRSRKRAQKESDPEELETGEKRARGLRSSQTEAEINSAKRLKQPLTRSMLKKQKGR